MAEDTLRIVDLHGGLDYDSLMSKPYPEYKFIRDKAFKHVNEKLKR